MNKIKIKTDFVYNKYIHDDIKVIHIADIHFNINTNKKKLKRISDSINQEKASYVIVTGDIIDVREITFKEEKIKELIDFFRCIALNNKVIISLGNHDIFKDSYNFFDRLNEIDNVYVLDNQEYADEFIYISGFTLPKNYYYNKSGKESIQIFLNYLDSHDKLVSNLPSYKVKIALIHSPINLDNNEILNKLCLYDMILCGHTHDGMVPDFLKFLFRGNMGIISPYKELFPKIAKGMMIKEVNDKKITIIITGGVTKLSLKSAKWLSKLNFVYNIGVNRIIIKKERGINNE